MGSNARQQIREAVEQGNAYASTSKDRRDTERISSGAIQRAKKGLLTKPNRTLQANDSEAAPRHNAAVKRAKRPVPRQPTIVGERESEPRYKQPQESTRMHEQRNYRAKSPRDHSSRLAQRTPPDEGGPAPAPTDAANHQTAAPQEPSILPDLGPDGVHRPCVAKLQESLFTLDDICKDDSRVCVQVEEIGRLIAVIRQKESEVSQKVRDVQRTRVTVERLYTSRVKLVPALIGLGEGVVQDAATEPEPEDEDETRTSLPKNKKRPAEEPEHDPSQEIERRRSSPKRVRAA